MGLGDARTSNDIHHETTRSQGFLMIENLCSCHLSFDREFVLLHNYAVQRMTLIGALAKENGYSEAEMNISSIKKI